LLVIYPGLRLSQKVVAQVNMKAEHQPITRHTL